MLRAFASGLFVLGLILEGLGFVVSNLDSYPDVEAFLAPEVTLAQQALDELREGDTISEDTVGFRELREIFLDSRERRGFWKAISEERFRSAFSFVEVEPGAVPELQGFTSSCEDMDFYVDSTSVRLGYVCGPTSVFGVDFDLSSAPIAHKIHSFDYLAGPVADRARANIHRAALSVFIVGIAFQIVGFVIGELDSRSTHAA